MIRKLRLLFDPGLYLFMIRRSAAALRGVVVDYLQHRPLAPQRLRIAPGAHVGRAVLIGAEPGIEDDDEARIEIESRAYVEDGAELGLVPRACLHIGRNTSIHRGCVILGNVRIGANCIFSYNIYVATGMHLVRERPTWLIKDQDDAFPDLRLRDVVQVDDDVWVGWGVFIRTNVHVGRGAVIGANAAVMSDVEPYAIYAGVPARKIGERLRFDPPSRIEAMEDGDLPYFYAGFLDDRASLAASRARGGVALAGAARLVLRQAAGGTATVEGTLEGEDAARIRVAAGGVETLVAEIAPGRFSRTIRVPALAAQSLPQGLRAHTVIDLDPGAAADRLLVSAAFVTGT